MLTANTPAADFAIEGKLASFRSSGSGRRYFCAACGTHTNYADGGAYVSFNVMLLDDPSDVRPRLHQCVASKLDWEEIADGLPQYPDSRVPAPGREP